jgi:hypothetical protein
MDRNLCDQSRHRGNLHKPRKLAIKAQKYIPMAGFSCRKAHRVALTLTSASITVPNYNRAIKPPRLFNCVQRALAEFSYGRHTIDQTEPEGTVTVAAALMLTGPNVPALLPAGML